MTPALDHADRRRREPDQDPEPDSSLWIDPDATRYPTLSGPGSADVVVVGAGIAGLTVAALLVRAGRRVVVLEARELATGTSGKTTAKVTALQGLRYRTISQVHGPDSAHRYAAAQLQGLEWMAEQVRTTGVDCAWERRPAVTYATTVDGARQVAEELTAATAAGLEVTATDDPGLPFSTTAALTLGDQAQFDPGPYLAALAAEIDASPSGHVHERSRVTAIRGVRDHEVVTEHGTVTAHHVVVATLLPIVDRGLFFARAEPKSSYITALRANGPLPRGMYLSADSPTRSLRTAVDTGGEVLLVGGGGHHTGAETPTFERYEELERWARRHFDVSDPVARWSAHDYVSADHLPWVGASSPVTPRVLVATGFEKWGMTMGTAAALAIADRILDPPKLSTRSWAGLFDTSRLAARGIVSAARLNAEVAVRLTTDWARPEEPGTGTGAGRRRRSGIVPVGEPAAGSGDRVTVVCTHLGGVCRWNDTERTWDCPLHGSRFGATGEVLTAPATRPLRRTGPG